MEWKAQAQVVGHLGQYLGANWTQNSSVLSATKCVLMGMARETEGIESGAWERAMCDSVWIRRDGCETLRCSCTCKW